ncbi:MAG: methyltransferase domain-containing protein, partial [Proteobacteria bacterium]|nr:methyltransferase domain-containing protein [Pseudomonadota bacterium]
DVFLEKRYDDSKSALRQRGNAPALQTNKPVIYYDGGKFPFADAEFDYVICSHVLEHIEDVPSFILELQRIAPKGYIEFPTIYYDFIYNFQEHLTFLLFENSTIWYMAKEESGLNHFLPVNAFFLETLDAGYDSLILDLKTYFFQGFEWLDKIKHRKAMSLDDIILKKDQLHLLQKHSEAKKISVFLFIKNLIKSLKNADAY